MVEDGVGILKVGPALTYAMREALFALSFAEDELYDEDERSHFRKVLDDAMLANPKNWKKHYVGTEKEIALKREHEIKLAEVRNEGLRGNTVVYCGRCKAFDK